MKKLFKVYFDYGEKSAYVVAHNIIDAIKYVEDNCGHTQGRKADITSVDVMGEVNVLGYSGGKQ